ncbi:16S rRNA (guanine(527)-N(7))-methyltransferase RsmG [Rhizobacter sp. LjRoot28]|uniref:16S rRNA (guanine(527)-N(7))-methyltransferase RsmG n=1 Tax=Rhizobacter sp. LjRoot28 TaxID=3342309 RepID=UPI003ED01840
MRPPEVEALSSRLSDGLADLRLDLTDIQQSRLLDYLALIAKWNRVYNLTAVRAPAEMLVLHLLDSLAVLPALLRHVGKRPVSVLDVGSGAGLPGVVLAIALPSASVTCVDTVGKKASFIQQVAAELKLSNLAARHARVETLDMPPADVVTSRAFSSLLDFVTLTRHLVAKDGVWMAMKGKRPVDEQAALPADVEVFHVEQLTVPGLDADRSLVWMRNGG